MFDKPENVFILILLFIPILAIAGGIVVGIMKTLTQQRQIELLQRERIAALERGIDPSKLPPVSGPATGEDLVASLLLSPAERARRQSQGLMIGGIITFAVGAGVMILFAVVEQHGEAWAMGIVPMTIGVALLLCAWLVRPRGNGGAPPRLG